MAYSISSDKTELNFDSFGNVGTNIKITLDSSVDNNSYYIDDSSYYTWFNIKRDRNQLTIFVKPNFSTEERIGYITCIHNLDFNVRTYITVSQDGMIYDVTAIESEIILPSNEEKNREIDVNVTGGSENFYIKSIKQYNTTKQIVNGVDEELPYDKGLQLTKIWNEDKKKWQLSIKSYGRTFVDDTNYYIITLAHKDNRKVIAEIKVRYTEGSYNINVSPSSLNFNYKGETDTNTVEISFPNTVDYGYIIDYTEEEWFTVTENPTSITVDVTVNGTQEERKVDIYVNDTNTKIEVIQEPYKGYDIILSDNILTFEKDEIISFDVTFKVYGDYNEEFSEPQLDGGSGWLKKSNKILDVKGALYNQYTISLDITKKNNNKDNNEAKLKFVHQKEPSITKELLIIQYGTDANENTIDNSGISGNTITVTTNPEDSQIVAQSTAVWCEITINEHTITVKCAENLWGKERKCKIMVQNAEIPTKTIYYKVIQGKKSEDFTITIE